ncbi:MAG: malate synthase A [Planctomycetota bacterium]
MKGLLDVQGVELIGPLLPGYDEILTPEALHFVASLERRFRGRRRELLALRHERQLRVDSGALPDFLPGSADIRQSDWKVAPVPADLRDRRVEITGPVERKMIINALNSGARVFMADFEDSSSPTWANMLDGQVNLRDAAHRTIHFTNEAGKEYALKADIATLMVRPRGWHLEEKHMLVDGEVVSGSLFDFALFFFHNAQCLLDQGTGPYFYLPKLESHLEARLWNDVFCLAQDTLGIDRGTIKATVLIETIGAAFEMDEILFELRDHSAGLNCGRWDYIFSVIKKFKEHPGFVLPDRGDVTMTTHFLRSYSRLLVRTCHRRGAHAMGGMAAQIPIKDDPEANRNAIDKVVADKKREVLDGHDGTWVAHPGLVAVAMQIFDEHMPEANQIDAPLSDDAIEARDLLAVPTGDITAEGLRQNLAVGLHYVAAWLRGQGCVPLNHLMEDAATAEISRAQVWQWIRHSAETTDGDVVTAEMALEILAAEVGRLHAALTTEEFEEGLFELAANLLEKLITASEFETFLTLPGYEHL